MAPLIHLDTHVAVWLYAGRIDLLSEDAIDAIERTPCAISPMVLLELRFLQEVGRLVDEPAAVIGNLATTIGLRVADQGLGSVVDYAQELSWTRDPFDRIIAAQATASDVPLVTRDRTIRAHCPNAIW